MTEHEQMVEDCEQREGACTWVDVALDETDDATRTRKFVAGCVERGLCPMCIASGARGECSLDMLESCPTCGWRPEVR